MQTHAWLVDIKTTLAARSDIKDLRKPNRILGVTTVRDRVAGTIILHQGSYIRKLLDKFGMSACESVAYLGVPTIVDSTSRLIGALDHSLYRQLTCSLVHLTVLTRPDIVESVARLCRYLHSPTTTKLSDCRHVFRYLKDTADMGVTYGGRHLIRQGYNDNNFTFVTSNGRSITSFAFSCVALS